MTGGWERARRRRGPIGRDSILEWPSEPPLAAGQSITPTAATRRSGVNKHTRAEAVGKRLPLSLISRDAAVSERYAENKLTRGAAYNVMVSVMMSQLTDFLGEGFLARSRLPPNVLIRPLELGEVARETPRKALEGFCQAKTT